MAKISSPSTSVTRSSQPRQSSVLGAMTSAHKALGARADLGEIVDGGAAAVDQEMVGVGAMEIDFSHVPVPHANRPAHQT